MLGASSAIPKPAGAKEPPWLWSRISSAVQTALFSFSCFYLDWDLQHFWMLGIIQQAVVISLHLAVCPSMCGAVPASQLFLQCPARVGSIGFKSVCRVPVAVRAPLSSTFCCFCHLKAQCEFWARWKLFFTLDKSLRSSCSCCGESPSFGTLHGLCCQHCRDVSCMGLFPVWVSGMLCRALGAQWKPVCTQLLWYSCTEEGGLSDLYF